MPKVIFGTSPASTILRIKLLDSSKSDGSGITGLNFSATGLAISTIKSNESSATYYTATGSTIETITTLGTYAAPTATKCRFKEIDSTYHKGVYELQLADARFSATDSLLISIAGASNLAESDFEVQCKNLAADLKAIDGELTNGNNATLNLKKLSIVTGVGNAVDIISSASGGHGVAIESTHGSTGGDAVYVHGTSSKAVGIYAGGNNDALHLEGSGTGNGLYTLAGATGDGIKATAYSGNGIKALGATNGTGIWAEGAGTGAGMRAEAGTNAIGFLIQGHQQAGISVASGAGNAPAIEASGTGSGAGIKATGGATGSGLVVLGGATSGHGMEALGGGTGAGIKAVGGDDGFGNGHGIEAMGGTTGHGISTKGGATYGNGLYIKSLGDHGMFIDGDLKGAVIQGNDGEGMLIESVFSEAGSAGIKAIGYSDGAGLELTSGETGVDLLLTNATHNLFNFIIDGVSTSAIMSNVLSMASGKFDKDSPTPGDVTFYMQDNITPAFTMHITATQRTRTYQAP
jgi:hypothetical protein